MRIYQTARRVREEWTPWFAWFPVQCEMADGRCAWLFMEKTERKETYGYGGPSWRYRELLIQNVDDCVNKAVKGEEK